MIIMETFLALLKMKEIIIQDFKLNQLMNMHDIMNNLNLPDPKLMDIAIPRNLKLGEK